MHAFPASILADAADIPAVIFRALVLIVIAIAAMYAVLRLRRWLKEDDVPTGGIGFSLGDLRAMHRRGEISDAEFEKARSQMLDGAKKLAETLPDPLARSNRTPQRPAR